MTNITGIRIDNIKNVIVMNYKFAAAAAKYNTPEYKLLQAIKADNPYMLTEIRAGRNRTTCNASKRLTYKNMETYISAQLNAEQLLVCFRAAIQESKASPSPYAFVRNWFVTQCPDYKECKTLFNTPEITEITTKINEKKAA